MQTQIFKKVIPLDIIEEFIKENCIVEKNEYIFNKYCFKKALLNDKINIFLKTIIPYYHESKKYYVERELTYIRFATILRQICKTHNILIVSKIKYYNSTYENIYFINMNK